MDDTVAQAALADLFGVTTRTVRDLGKRGILVRAGKNYALAESVSRYCAHLRELATGRGGEDTIINATAERARLAKAQADSMEIKNAKLRGELVRADEVENEWSGLLRTLRASMMAVPSRVAQRVPTLTPHDISEIDAEVRAAMTEIGSSKSDRNGGSSRSQSTAVGIG